MAHESVPVPVGIQQNVVTTLNGKVSDIILDGVDGIRVDSVPGGFEIGFSGGGGGGGRAADKLMLVPMAGFTPEGTGADVVHLVIPPNSEGNSATFNIIWISLCVETAGGAPAINIESSGGTGAFAGGNAVASVSLASNAYKGQANSELGSVTTGERIRVVVDTLGSAQNWTIQMMLVEQLS